MADYNSAPPANNPFRMHTNIYLSLGSNVGDRSANLKMAIATLANLGEVVRVSSMYETAPVPAAAQPWFLNCAVQFASGRMPKQLLGGLLAIERAMGRRRKRGKGPRIIDIDILLYGGSIIRLPGLTIPHPTMHERRFVLEPMFEIAPDAHHPILKRTIRELLEALPPGQVVRRST